LGQREQATDGEVVRAVLAGDVEQYAVLVHRYRDRYARFAAGNPQSLRGGCF
jgi:hypothetical protein